jgi:uncharacterized protein DUF2442
MKSARRGKSTLDAEVVSLSKHGFWVLVAGRELFLPFREFPWFESASVRHVLNVEMPHTTYLRWPDLDVDLAVESIEHPARFPLTSRARSGNGLKGSRARKTAPRSARSGRSGR